MTMTSYLTDSTPVSLKQVMRTVLALLMILVTVVGTLPLQLFANTVNPAITSSEDFVGEVTHVVSSEQGEVLIHADIDGETRTFYVPSDENIAIAPHMAVGDTFAARARGGMLPQFVGIGGTPASAMATGLITTGMYYIEVDGQQIHVFCVDASRPGPAQAGPYQVTLIGDSSFTNVRGNTITLAQLEALLARGYPARTPAELGVANSQQAYYATRMAIAMLNEWPNQSLWHANPNVAGSQTVLDAIRAIANPSPQSLEELGLEIIPFGVLNEFSTFIAPNGEEVTLTPEQAQAGFLTYRSMVAALNTEIALFSSNMTMTPPEQDLELGNWTSEIYRVENAGSSFSVNWGAGTPAGAQILDANYDVVWATFPHNLENHTGYNAFRIRIPDQTSAGSLSFEVVGASGVGTMGFLAPTNPNHQHLIPYFEPVERQTSGVLRWIEPVEESGRLRIIKTDMTGNNLGGARFTITGPQWPNGHTVTVPANGWTSGAIAVGQYTITEIQAPNGFTIASNPTQTVTVTEGHTTTVPAIVTFANERIPGGEPEPLTTAVRIQKIDALSRENIPGAMMRLVGMSANYVALPDGQTISFNNTGINIMQVLTAGAETAVPGDVTSTVTDGVWTLEGLPFGFYMVYEYRAPDGFSLLPAHTARGFWLAPPNVNITVNQPDLNITGDGNQNEWNVDWSLGDMSGNMGGGGAPEAGWNAEGSITIPGDSMAPPEFEIIETPNPSSVNIIFENFPFSEIVVYKRAINNGIEGDYLAGAVFQIQGYFAEGNASQIIDMIGTTDANGRLVFRGLPAGNYTITELQAPAGFMMDMPNHRSVNVSWGQIDGHPTRPAPSIVFFNTPKSSLEIHKIDGSTGQSLASAVFEITDPATGETWQATTDASGRAVFGRGALGNFLYPGRTYIVREIVAPPGFILDTAPREVVLTPGDNNIITWINYHNPSLTIIKRDMDTHEYLAGAVFTVEFENGRTVQGSPFTTDETGRIVLPYTLFTDNPERTLIVTEIIAPPGFNLATPNWQRVVMREGEDNVVVFENRRMPTLTIQKIDARTGYPIQGAWFEIEFLGATAGTGTNNIGPPGPLTGNPFITDSNGRITIPHVYSGRYRIREVRAANNYWLTPLEQDRTWIIEVRDNEDYVLVVENTLLPTLVITKRNALTWRPIPMTQFRVDFEVPNSPSVQHIGYFMTNQQGQIILPFVQSGWYRVQETRPAFGMTLATNNHFRVFLSPGDNSYELIRNGIIASESMMVPVASAPVPTPPATDEPAFEPSETDEEREYLAGNGNQTGSTNVIANAPTPDIPTDVEVEVIAPDTEAIIDENLAPEVSEPSALPSVPDLDHIDWDNIDDDTNITLIDNPELLARVNRSIQIGGGDQFWDNNLNVWNFPQNSLIIRKEDATTGQLLQGATFSVTQISSGNDSGLAGTIIGHFTTNHSGIIVISGLDPGYFVIEETTPPSNFALSTNNRQHSFLRPDGTSIVEVTFSNLPYGSLIVTLRDSVTAAPIPNAEFRITNSAGAVVGTDNGHFWTNLQGEILIPNVVPDSYVITQITTPPTHVIGLVNSTQTIRVQPTGQIYRVDFFNDPLSQLLITLRNEVTGQPIQGGEFRVTNSAGNVVGSSNGIFFTNLQGEILIPSLGTDSYVVTQLNAPDGFRLGEQNSQTIFVSRPAETYALNFTNEPYSGLIIQNLDGFNGDPLAGVRFRVEQINDTGNVLIGEHVTDANGRIELLGLLGSFNVIQLDVPNGWEFDAQPTRIIHINTGTPTLVTFHSPRMGSLEITLADEDGNPLAGGRFEVRRQNGQFVGEFVTPSSGMVSLPNLSSGWYTVEQVAPVNGFVMTDTGRSVEVAANTVARANFVNIQQPSLVIDKVDTAGNPLAGAEFEVRTVAGELVHRGITNNGGIISIARLEPGTFIITETRAPQGFVITEPSRTVQIVAGQTLTERFVNYRTPSLIIEKVDTDGNPLAGAEFEVRTLSGELVHRAVTGTGGVITIEHLDPGAFIITETRAPQGFVITEPSRTIQVVAGQTLVERFINHRAPSLIIEKADTDGNPLAGAEFEIRRLNGELVYRLVTNQGGLITIEHLDPGSYEITETQAPEGFAIVEPSRAVRIVAGETRVERFVNPRLATFVIRKLDGVTNELLQGVVFEITTLTGEHVRNPQNGSFEFITDNSGLIRLPDLPAGSYVATETRPLPGFMAAEPVHFVVGHDREYIITVRNYRYPDYNILKIDGHTGKPLAGVEFEIAHFFADGRRGERLRNPVDGSFVWTTDRAGLIRIPNLAHGTYVITETRTLPGFILADPVIVVVDDHHPTTITIRNYRYAEWNILKLDGHTGRPQQGVVFEVAHFFGTGTTGDRLRNPQNGSFEFVTDVAGIARIGALPEGTFIITETRPLPGFIPAEPVIITVTGSDVDTTITIRNYRMGDINLLKVDGDTNQPLQGVVFEIHRQNGERIQNPANHTFEFVTDNAGRINLGFLAPGSYLAVETRPLPGFILADPVPFEVIEGRDLTVTVRNYRVAQLTIRKVNSITRAPLEGVIFEISRPDGTRLINPQTGFTDFITDRNGLIFLPTMEDGRFYLREARALPGFIIDQEVIPFTIDASARQREHLLVVENTPAAGLLVTVTDAQTRRPLEGIEIEVRHADGRIVTGAVLDGNQPSTPANSPQLAPSGNFLTDNRGRVNLNHLAPGVYHVRILSGLTGYQADTDVHVVTVVAGDQATLNISIAPLAGLRLLHVDAITGEGIFNVEFMLFDHNGQVVGNFYTDNNGVIDFGALLAPGRYTIRMTRPAPGYEHDDVPRTVEFVAGRVTEIVWEAIPIAGQLQIQVVSGDSNQHNALPAGTPLVGAIFEIVDARTGNLVDRIISNDRGMAISRPLPLNRYIVRQVTAPAFYMINPQEIDFTLEHTNQIIRATFPNFSANMGVTIRKTGPQEVMQGHNIRYDIPVVRNDSTTPLADFFWRDTLPTEAVRIDRLVTGTYNHALRYRVLATTNRGNQIVVADNLSTTVNNVIEMRPVHLGLAADEFVVDFTLYFGQVPAGFTSVEAPQVFVDVLHQNQAFLPDGMMFANLVDIGGRIPGTEEWVIGNSTAATTIFNPTRRTIPQSGW